MSVARAQGFPEGRGRRIAKFGFGKNEVKFGELPSFGISRKGRSEAFARDLQSSRNFAAEERGTLRKDCQNVSMRRGKIEGGQVAALRAGRILRSRASAAGGNRTACSARTNLPLWRLCFRRRRRRMARYCRPFKPGLPLRSEYFPKPGKRCAGTRLSRIVRRRWGSHFFSGARKPAGFSRSGAQVGENALQAFSERAAAAFRLRAFLSRDKDWSFRDVAGWGILCPIFREISAERDADRENN